MDPIIAANWKMNLNSSEATQLIESINQAMSNKPEIDLIICPSFTYLNQVASQLTAGSIAAQNMSEFESGAYTGEISASMIQSSGASHVLLGHSERRHKFNETNDMIKQKLLLCEKHNLIPILCVGETLEERHAGLLNMVINEQLSVINDFKSKYYIAYEPVWAIGTGETATPETAEEVHAHIRKIVGEKTPVLYGGSVNANNIRDLLLMANINGALIGGASLKATEFSEIIKISHALERV